jgi:glycosyltransferase involved in cell wall biosynthesis
MRIGIFVLMAGRNAGGPETYEVELIRALARHDRANEYIVYCTGEEAVRAIAVRQENFRYQVLEPGFRPVSVALTLPWMLARDGVDFYHATFTPPPYARSALAFTMHCVSSIVHPEFYHPATAWRLNYLMKIGITRAERILCVSRTTMAHVEEMFHIPVERMSVSYNGVGSNFVPVPSDEARERVGEFTGMFDPYLLFVGKLQAHKNVDRMIRSFHKMRMETGSRLKLLIAGRVAGNSVDVRAIAKELGIEQHVITPGYVPFELLPSLYSAARAFVFPSLWEGFGIPIIEAMACGTPVIASTATCLPEVAGGAALLFDPNSTDPMAEAMAKVDSDEAERRRMIDAGFQRASFFSWDNCARATLAAYASMSRH